MFNVMTVACDVKVYAARLYIFSIIFKFRMHNGYSLFYNNIFFKYMYLLYYFCIMLIFFLSFQYIQNISRNTYGTNTNDFQVGYIVDQAIDFLDSPPNSKEAWQIECNNKCKCYH